MMHHGLMFGNFGYRGDWVSVEHYRAFGNHRIATHLRKQGWDVECLDYTSAFTQEELIAYLDSRITDRTVFIGISMIFFVDDKSHIDFITKHVRAKYPHVKIISGGVKYFAVSGIDADFYVTGNGEYAMDAIVSYLAGHGEKPRMKEVSTGGYYIDAVQDYKCFPKRDAAISFEERDYIQPNETLNIEFARGCKFKCTYCSFPLIGLKGDMSRDEDSVYEEMLENYQRWGVTNYYITDDTVNDRPEKMAKMASAIRRLPFTPHLSGYARADLIITHGKETWDDMIDMGFTAHSYGVETLNHKSGKAVYKGMDPEKIKDGLLQVQDYFTNNCKNYYTGTMTMIAGLPYETFDSLDNTKKWLNTYWGNHGIYYLPLLIQEEKGTEFSDNYNKIGEDFLKFGYKYSSNVPDIIHPQIRRNIDHLEQMKEKHGDIIYNNFWEHHSGDYDIVDMMEWIHEFFVERHHNKMNSLHCFETIWSTMQTDRPQKDFYGRGVPQIDRNKNLNELIAKYKRNKLRGL